ncbi:MAG: hypothetical protein JSS82_06430 [Bacteroidetes bacterium]|nr:hypothetical protein [Bacteroidota bacterium]
MRTVIAILIMFSLSFQTMVKMAIIGWYELNKEYIAKNLCENRDKPQMKCCGKCYLRKQLKKAEDGNEANSKQAPCKLTKIEIAEFIPSQSFYLPEHFASILKQHNPRMQHMHDRLFPLSIFHPPSDFC